MLLVVEPFFGSTTKLRSLGFLESGLNLDSTLRPQRNFVVFQM